MPFFRRMSTTRRPTPPVAPVTRTTSEVSIFFGASLEAGPAKLLMIDSTIYGSKQMHQDMETSYPKLKLNEHDSEQKTQKSVVKPWEGSEAHWRSTTSWQICQGPKIVARQKLLSLSVTTVMTHGLLGCMWSVETVLSLGKAPSDLFSWSS